MTRARVVVETRLRHVEDRLERQLFAFIDIDERLMRGVVRKHPRLNRVGARRTVDVVLGSDAHRLTIRKRLGCRPRRRSQCGAVGHHANPRSEEVDERALFRREKAAVEQSIRRFDLQIVSDVEHVDDD